MIHTVGSRVVGITVRQLWGIQELLIAHVALTAAKEDVGTLLPLNALVTAEDTVALSSTQIYHWNTNAVNLAHNYTFLSLNTSLWSGSLNSDIISEGLNGLKIDVKAHKQVERKNNHKSPKHTFSKHTHQITAKGSGSRPALAPASPRKRAGAVWAEGPRLSGAPGARATLSFRNQR